MNRALAILGFHKIGDPPPGRLPTPWYVSERRFVSQLSWLLDAGWQPVDVATFLEGLRVPDALPARAALLTFDDGYRSLRDVALPHLTRLGCPALLFVPTAFIGGWNEFDAGSEPDEPICDWADLRALERAGVSVQSHGVSHRRLSWLEPPDVEDELRRSKATLEAGLGKMIEVFAHPYGDEGADPRVLPLVLSDAGYRAGCLYGGGANRVPPPDPYRLARVPMGPDTDLRDVLGAS